MSNESFEDIETEYKPYTVNEYNNSDDEPLGISLNGKSKCYVDAHEALRNKIKKGLQYTANGANLRVLDVKNIPAVKTAVIEVSSNGKNRGNAELKVYRPSVHKKKGASIEMRKSAGFDYKQVDILRNIVVYFLDQFMIENDTDDKNSEYINCDKCDWKTKSKAALKTHVTRIHSKSINKSVKSKASYCTTNTKPSLNKHTSQGHCSKRKKSASGSQSSSLNSSLQSPPKKKDCPSSEKNLSLGTVTSDKNVVETVSGSKVDLQNVVGNLEKEVLHTVQLLSSRITQLESLNVSLQQEVTDIDKKYKYLITKVALKKPPEHLAYVQERHVHKLNGYIWRYRAMGNGACATNSIALALYGNERAACSLKRKTLNHIAEHYEDYYYEKFGLPFKENVGTGKNAITVDLKTKEEMVKFLKSDQALLLWSSSEELHAMANLFNMNINVFTYGKTEERWNTIGPNPDIVAKVGLKFSVPSEVSLYHEFEEHFDLLVHCNDSLASPEVFSRQDKNEDATKDKDVKGKPTQQVAIEEQLLRDVEDMELDPPIEGADKDAIDVENTDVDDKSNSKDHEVQNQSMILCSICDLAFKTQELLKIHEKTHEISCDKCGKMFNEEFDLKKHVCDEHIEYKKISKSTKWNCSNCDYEGSSASELRKHLKETGHSPNCDISDRKQVFEDYRECYTCKMDFEGYISLMEHRKAIHPSNKKCKNYDSGKCIYGDKCWYVHSNDSETEGSKSVFKCNLCDESFEGRGEFLVHKKQYHSKFVPDCEKFSLGKCSRGNECWFVHKNAEHSSTPNSSNESSSASVFQKDRISLPPDSVGKMVELMEKLNLTMQTLAQSLKQ